MFFDHLIRELAICLNVGDTALNREQLVPTYVKHSQAKELVENENYIFPESALTRLMKCYGKHHTI